LVDGDEARIRQAFLNLKRIAQSEGATLQDCVRITVYISDLHGFAPLVSKVQAELWGNPPYPPRTMFEVQRLFDDDIVEIDSYLLFPSEQVKRFAIECQRRPRGCRERGVAGNSWPRLATRRAILIAFRKMRIIAATPLLAARRGSAQLEFRYSLGHQRERGPARRSVRP
jgi:hypothetical protein